MNDLDREKKKGLSLVYLVRVLFMRMGLGRKYQTRASDWRASSSARSRSMSSAAWARKRAKS